MAKKVYFSSADIMPRNLERRVELLTPATNEEIADIIYSNIAGSGTRGKVEINKVDSATMTTIPQGEASLSGAKFNIIDKFGECDELKMIICGSTFSLPLDSIL